MSHLLPFSAIDTDYFTDNKASGGDGGRPFTFLKADKGAILTRIKAWKSDWRVTCVEIWMSDGSHFLAGKHKYGSPTEFNFKTGELITSLNVQASDTQSAQLHKRRLGAIYFKTNKGRSWGIYSNDLPGNTKHWPNVGSGMCCGIFGKHGDAVDCLGFAMLRKIDNAILSDVKYPNLSLEIVGSTPETVAHQVFKNGLDEKQSFILKGERSVTITRSWSQETAIATSVTVSVTTGIPIVASVETGFSWGVSSTSTYEVSDTVTGTHAWEWPLVCPPHRQILGKATMYADEIDTEYEGTMELRLTNGKVFKYKVTGIYDGLNARSGTVTVDDLGPYNG